MADLPAERSTPWVRQVQRRWIGLGAGLLAANLAGAAFIFTYITFIAPAEQPPGASPMPHRWVQFGLVLALTVPITCAWMVVHIRRATAWVGRGEPDAVARRRVLALPHSLAWRALVPWVASAAYYVPTQLGEGYSWSYLLKLGVVVGDGALVTAVVNVLVTTRFLRPLFAAAMAGEAPRHRVFGLRFRLVVAWMVGSGVVLVGIALLPLFARGADVRTDIDLAVVVLSVAGLGAGGFITLVAAGNVAAPLGAVRKALAQVQAGNLDVQVPVDAPGELGMLQAGVNEMVAGLRERQRLADLFGRHVGSEVAAQALVAGTGLASETRDASVLFVDLIGSTAMAEVLPPAEVVATLNGFFAAVVSVVASEGGWVNKFEGDGALCVFGVPAVQPDHATRALRAARVLRAVLGDVRADHPGLDAGIGVSSGNVVAGNVGTESRYEYTVLGGPVNEAARLTDLAKQRDGRVLASGAALAAASPDERARWTDVGTVALRGKSSPTAVWRPVALEPTGELPAVEAPLAPTHLL